MLAQNAERHTAAPLGQDFEIGQVGIRLLVENVRDYAILLLDIAGNIVTWNKGAELLKGYAPNEIIGRHFLTFYPPEDIEAGKPALDLQTAEESGRFEDEGWRVRKDGSQFWANVVLTALRDETGKLRGFGQVTRDFTKRNQTVNEKLQMAVESAPNAMVIINRDGQIVLVNAQTEKMFGYLRAELLGQSVELLVPDRFRGKHPAQRGKFFDDPQSRAMGAGRDLFGRRKNGSEFPVEIGLSPVRTDEGLFVISAIVDITERKQSEQDIRTLNESLEQRVLQLASANQELESFTYSVSHDLRAPLRAIDGFSRILLDDFAGALPNEGKVYLHHVRENTRQMGQLVDNLLAFSRLGRQAIIKHSVEPDAIVRNCLAEMIKEQEGR